MIETAGLRVMRAISEEGSFTAAAHSLGYSQPAISQMVRRMEERFPAKGGAPEQPPLPEMRLVWERKPRINHWAGYVLAAIAGGITAWALMT